ILFGLCCLLLGVSFGYAQSVYLLFDKDLPQARYGEKMLRQALEEKGYGLLGKPEKYDYLINLDINAVVLGKEAFSIIPDRRPITMNGWDPDGLIYGCFGLSEEIKEGVPLSEVVFTTERPTMEFRGIKHNLPWDAHRANPALE